MQSATIGTDSKKLLAVEKRPRDLLRGSVLTKCNNWATIFCRHRSIFKYGDEIGMKSYRIRWNNAK